MYILIGKYWIPTLAVDNPHLVFKGTRKFLGQWKIVKGPNMMPVNLKRVIVGPIK